MSEDVINHMCSLSQEFFKIIKEEYSIYLSEEKKNFLNNVDISKLYKIISNSELPNIFYLGGTYYFNNYYKFENIEKMIPFLCLSSIISNLNPLKIGLIEVELLNLKIKYNLNIDINFASELEVADIVSRSLLNNIPFKIIFKDSDSDIVNYLQEEENSEIALCYYNVSKQMKYLRNKINDFQSNINIDYSTIIDYIYDFIGTKVR